MLSSDHLETLIKTEEVESSGVVIVPNPFAGEKEQIGGTSIDLRLGKWFVLLQQSKRSMVDFGENRKEAGFASKDGRTFFIPFGEPFVLHPNRFALAVTFEWISLPRTIAAYISGKSSLGRMGLIIETAAGIHPGFSGCITLELFNCGEVPIQIYPGMRICQVFFHSVEGEVTRIGSKFGGRRRPAFGSYEPDATLRNMISRARQLDLAVRN